MPPSNKRRIRVSAAFEARKIKYGKRFRVNTVAQNSENKPWGLYFSKALFEGLIFGGAYVRREICVSKSTGLALFLKGNLPFFFVLLCN